MRNIFLLLFLIAGIFGCEAQPFDSVRLRATYHYHCVTDTVGKATSGQENWLRRIVANDTMRLDCGRESSRFYSVRYARYDSLRRARITTLQNCDDAMTLSERPLPEGESHTIWKHYPAPATLTFTDVIFSNRFLYEEPCESLPWQFLSDTVLIAGYTCRKAQCEFRGRCWTAWYCPDIPVSDGPWKLYGLPGLIFRAEDAAHHYTFELIGLQQPNPQPPLVFPNEQFSRTDRKHYQQYKRKSLRDPLETFNSSQRKITIRIKSDSEFAPKLSAASMPYELIERD